MQCYNAGLKISRLKLSNVAKRNNISMNDFARASRLSKPFVETLLKVSFAVGITMDELLRKLGGEEIDLR